MRIKPFYTRLHLRCRYIAGIFFILMCVPKLFGQTRVQVLDRETKLPVAYANVWIKGASGTTTDIDGYFTVADLHTGRTATITSIGYGKTEVTLQPEAESKIYLDARVIELQAVQIVAKKTKKAELVRLGMIDRSNIELVSYPKNVTNQNDIKMIKFDWYEKQ